MKEIYSEYEKWCSDNGYGTENRGNFTAEMKKRGMFAASGTVRGKTYRNVIKGFVIAAEDEILDNLCLENPFEN